jgi:shikimate dehydrogenase
MNNIPQQCLVIGDPIQHSLSPLIHNAGYEALHIEKEFHFESQQVPKHALEQFIRYVRHQGIRGISVTIPHKVSVMNYLDIIDDGAQEIGAVNTIVYEGGILHGYNTDWLGIIEPLKKRTGLQHKKVVILGAGGAARAAVYGMKREHAKVWIMNRTTIKGKELAQELNCEFAHWNDKKILALSDIIINTTPVGMFPHIQESPLSKDVLLQKHIVFDIVYHPWETTFLQYAKEKGSTIIHGTEMFIYQAVEQFRLYTGKEAPIEDMEHILLQRLQRDI